MTTNYKKIAGNPHTSTLGVMMYASIYFMILTILFTLDLKIVLLFTLVELTFIWGAGALYLNYFVVTDKNLLIKNHLLSRVNICYELNQIDSVTFENISGVGNKYFRSIRIKTLLFKKRLFFAATLEQEHWDELKKIFEGLNIPVTDRTKEPFL